MNEKFDWEDVYKRRCALAKKIQRRIGLSFSLTAGIKKPFGLLPGFNEQSFADLPMWRVPFYTVAQMMNDLSKAHIIDHAWWLIANDRSDEPWGFVTEPYIDLSEAKRVIKDVSTETDIWGIEFEILPKSQSAWFPKNTTPIIITCSVGGLYNFIQYGVRATLDKLRPWPFT